MNNLERFSNVKGFSDLIGLQLKDMADGCSTLFIDINDSHLNSGHIVHGGVYASLLDSAAGAAIYSIISMDQFAPTVSMSISYLAAASQGRLYATGTVTRKGSRIVHCEAQVSCDGETLATCQAVFTLGERRTPLNDNGASS